MTEDSFDVVARQKALEYAHQNGLMNRKGGAVVVLDIRGGASAELAAAELVKTWGISESDAASNIANRSKAPIVKWYDTESVLGLLDAVGTNPIGRSKAVGWLSLGPPSDALINVVIISGDKTNFESLRRPET